MDLLEEDDNIFTFSVPYDNTDDRRSYDEASTIVVDNEKKKIEPFKKLPILVEDTDLDVGDVIIHTYGNRTPVETLKLEKLKNAENSKYSDQEEENCGQNEKDSKKDSEKESEKDSEKESGRDSEKDREKGSEKDTDAEVTVENSNNNKNFEERPVLDVGFLNDNNNESPTESKNDDLVELDSSYATTSDDSPDTTQQTVAPSGGQLLGGNAESLSLDLSMTDTDCDYHQTSLSTGLLTRHLPAPRFIAHQMALSISPERYMPKTRPKSNRYSISSSSPSEDGSQFELWAARKKTYNSRLVPTKLCIGLLVALLIVIILCIIIIPVVWLHNRSSNAIEDGLFGYNATTVSNLTIYDVTTIGHDIISNSHDVTSYTDHTASIIYDVTSASNDIPSFSHDVTSSHDITSYSHDVTSANHDVTSASYDITSARNNFTTQHNLTATP